MLNFIYTIRTKQIFKLKDYSKFNILLKKKNPNKESILKISYYTLYPNLH